MTSQVPTHETMHPTYGALVVISPREDSGAVLVAAIVGAVGGAFIAAVLQKLLGGVGIAIGIPLGLGVFVASLAFTASRASRFELYERGFIERIGGRAEVDVAFHAIASLEPVKCVHHGHVVADAFRLVTKADRAHILERCPAVEGLVQRSGARLLPPREITGDQTWDP